MKHEILINQERLLNDLEELRAISYRKDQGIFRPAMSNNHIKSMNWLMTKLTESGISYQLDSAYNLFATLENDNAQPAVVTGSHLDSVPAGGNLDGGLGVVAGLECLRTAKEAGISLKRPLQLIVFNDEEGYYGGMLGSSALAGKLTEEEVKAANNLEGESLEAAFRRNNLDFQNILNCKLDPEQLFSFTELHIEQGTVLEDEQKQIGIVNNICGIKKIYFSLKGEARHSGTTPIKKRKDALLCFAQIRTELDRLIRSDQFRNQLLNVGYLQTLHGAPNVVPGEVEYFLEIRSADNQKLELLKDEVISISSQVANNSAVQLSYQLSEGILPVMLDQQIIKKAEDICENKKIPYMQMYSGAAHDAQNMASLTASSLIFIPSIAGISHSPEEASRDEDIITGGQLLFDLLVSQACD